MIRNYILTAFRNIRRRPWFSVINIAGLALGMSCTVMILLWVHDELSFDNFHSNGEHIYRVNTEFGENRWESSPWALRELLIKTYPEVESATWFKAIELGFSTGEANSSGILGLISPEFFDIFSFVFFTGNGSSALPDANSVVITRKVAEELFGRVDPVGQKLRFESGQELIVTAILEVVPSNSHLQFDLLARPELFYGTERLSSWIIDGSTYLLLNGNTSYADFNLKISGIVNDNDGGIWGGEMFPSLQPLRKIHTHALKGTDPVVYVRIFALIAFIVLLISCINFINLSTSQAFSRSREIAFRKTVGSGRSEIFFQYLTETLVLALISMVFAVIITRFLLPLFGDLTGKELTLFTKGNMLIYLELAVVTILAGMLAGFYPSLLFTRYQPVQLFKGLVGKTGQGSKVRRVLMVFQFTAAIILLISVTIITRQMNYINRKEIGLNRENALLVHLDKKMMAKYDAIKEKLLKGPSIINVTCSSNSPLNTSTSSSVYWEGISQENGVLMNYVCVDYDYFETLGMSMKEGRTFSADYPSDQYGYIINETALKLTGLVDPVGKGVALSSRELNPIIGVVRDFHGTSLRNDIAPTIFFMFDFAARRNMFVRISGDDPAGTLDYIGSVLNEVVPGSFFSYRFLDDQFKEMYRRESTINSLVKYFALLALFIATIGLLGLASFMSLQRTREFAVRKVHGAEPWRIIYNFFKEFAMLIGISSLIAWPVSYFIMSRWLSSWSFRISPGILVFIVSGLAVLFMAFLVTSFHAYKTSRCNLVESLKYE